MACASPSTTSARATPACQPALRLPARHHQDRPRARPENPRALSQPRHRSAPSCRSAAISACIVIAEGVERRSRRCGPSAIWESSTCRATSSPDLSSKPCPPGRTPSPRHRVTLSCRSRSLLRTRPATPASSGFRVRAQASAPAQTASPPMAACSSARHRATCCTDSLPAASSRAAPARRSPQTPPPAPAPPQTHPQTSPTSPSIPSAADDSPTHKAGHAVRLQIHRPAPELRHPRPPLQLQISARPSSGVNSHIAPSNKAASASARHPIPCPPSDGRAESALRRLAELPRASSAQLQLRAAHIRDQLVGRQHGASRCVQSMIASTGTASTITSAERHAATPASHC